MGQPGYPCFLSGETDLLLLYCKGSLEELLEVEVVVAGFDLGGWSSFFDGADRLVDLVLEDGLFLVGRGTGLQEEVVHVAPVLDLQS